MCAASSESAECCTVGRPGAEVTGSSDRVCNEQEFKADKQNKELQKRQSAEINKLQKLKGTLEGLKAKADVQ